MSENVLSDVIRINSHNFLKSKKKNRNFWQLENGADDYFWTGIWNSLTLFRNLYNVL